MILTLEVSAPQGAKPGVHRRQVFNEEGGTIGRGDGSSLVLPHGKVSGRHALISCRNGVFYIEDNKSTNGVFMNSVDNRLAPRRPYALKSGDRIFIEPYEIRVSIAEEPNSLFLEDDPLVEVIGEEEVDPLKLLDPLPRRVPARKVKGAQDLEGGSLLDDHYQAPPVPPAPPRPSESKIPVKGYNPLDPEVSDDSTTTLAPRSPVSSKEQHSSVNPPPVIDVSTAASVHDVIAIDLADVMEGLGLDRAAVTPDLARNFGQILKVVVSGVMKLLEARRQIRDEFRMPVTHVRPVGNNPLKLSVNVGDALHNLFIKRNAAYLPPVEAFKDAFEDLENHQMAMLAGMRVAFDSMLAEFDPDRLQEEFDRQLNKGSLLSVPAKLRYWDLYRDRCRDMVKDLETSFRELFGEEFAKAYEDQLRRLKVKSSSSRDAEKDRP